MRAAGARFDRWVVIGAAAALALGSALSVPAFAKDSLGVFGKWAAFRDADTPRCYAIARARPSSVSRANEPYASVGNWPTRKIRGQVYFRLSHDVTANGKVTLSVGDKTIALSANGANAWAQNRSGDAAIVAAMRSASRMTVRGTRANGRRFSDIYDLSGAATAMDAATVACARR